VRDRSAGVRSGEQVLQDVPEPTSVGEHAGDLVLGGRRAAPELPGEQLHAGAQQRQRRAQLVARIGHEAPLHGQRLRERAHAAEGEHDTGGRREEYAEPAGREQRDLQPVPLRFVLLLVVDRLVDAIADPLGAHQVAVVAAVHQVLADDPVAAGRGEVALDREPLRELGRRQPLAPAVDHDLHALGRLLGLVDVRAGAPDGLPAFVGGRLVGDDEHGDADQDDACQQQEGRLQAHAPRRPAQLGGDHRAPADVTGAPAGSRRRAP
jgi:hypothetical protein